MHYRHCCRCCRGKNKTLSNRCWRFVFIVFIVELSLVFVCCDNFLLKLPVATENCCIYMFGSQLAPGEISWLVDYRIWLILLILLDNLIVSNSIDIQISATSSTERIRYVRNVCINSIGYMVDYYNHRSTNRWLYRL